MRQLIEKHREGDRQDDRILPEMTERAERVGAPPFERTAMIGIERFRQEEIAVDEIDEAETGDGEKRRAMAVDIADDSAERRTDDEAEAERRTHQAEIRRAFFRRRYVGDIGVRRREGRRKAPARMRAMNRKASDGASAINRKSIE